jgi:ribosome-associated protein
MSAEFPPPRPDTRTGDVSGPLRVPAGPGWTVVIPPHELSWRFSRSSGPGGQSVNTMDSRVELSWDLASSGALTQDQRERVAARLAGRLTGGPDGQGQVLTIAAAEQRSQLRNREAARERLAGLLAAALAPPPKARRPTKPSKGAVRRRVEDKVRRSDVKRLRQRPGQQD